MIAFTSTATNLVAAPVAPVDARQVYVRDMTAGTTQAVSVDASGALPRGGGGAPAVSGDGRHVVFESTATLLAADTNRWRDVYARDLQLGTTQLVSVCGACDSDGDGVEDYGYTAADVNHDGQFVAYVRSRYLAVSTSPQPGPAVEDVMLRDLSGQTSELVSVSTGGVRGNGRTYAGEPPVSVSDQYVAISADGRVVTFTSTATNLDAHGDTNGSSDVYVRNRTAGTTVRVSTAGVGSEPNGLSWEPGLSADGSQVVFVSEATNLAPDGNGSQLDIFIAPTTEHPATYFPPSPVPSKSASATPTNSASAPASTPASSQPPPSTGTPLVITGWHCESHSAMILCDVAYSGGTAPVTIRWTFDGHPITAGNDQTTLSCAVPGRRTRDGTGDDHRRIEHLGPTHRRRPVQRPGQLMKRDPAGAVSHLDLG